MRISIVTPTRNIAHWLPECLESVRSQEDEAELVEHIVVDGESTDGSAEIARRYGARVLEVEHQGLYAKINIGVRHAKGEVVGFLGGDDILLPGAIRIVDEWFKNGRNPMLVGGIRWTDPDGRSHGHLAPPPKWMTSEMFASLGWSCMHFTSLFIRRDFMEKLGSYDETYVYSGDYEFLARALSRSSFDRVSNILSAWRMHDHNLSKSKNLTIEEERTRIETTYGPPSPVKRYAYRLLLKVWLNSRSPSGSSLRRSRQCSH